jgi:hypothetical protein
MTTRIFRTTLWERRPLYGKFRDTLYMGNLGTLRNPSRTPPLRRGGAEVQDHSTGLQTPPSIPSTRSQWVVRLGWGFSPSHSFELFSHTIFANRVVGNINPLLFSPPQDYELPGEDIMFLPTLYPWPDTVRTLIVDQLMIIGKELMNLTKSHIPFDSFKVSSKHNDTGI